MFLSLKWCKLNCFVYVLCSYFVLSTAANVTIIRYIVKGSCDAFSINDSHICGLAGKIYRWCERKNAEQSHFTNELAVSYPCSCQCKWNHKTFLFDTRKCVGPEDLRDSGHFGNGKYLLENPLDLSSQRSLDIGVQCTGCEVDKVMYSMRSVWHEISTSAWNINNNGVLRWTSCSSTLQLQGKIFKITLKNCWTNSHCQWKILTSGAPTVFLKAIGNYTKYRDVVIPTVFQSSTPVDVLPTPALTSSPEFVSLIKTTTRATILDQTSSTAPTILSTPMHVTSSSSHSVCGVCPKTTPDTVNIGPTTILSSTLSPTPTLITSKNLMTSPSEQGNTYTRYTSTRTEITEQVSTATVILVSPAWDNVSSEIFPKSTSAVIQYSTTPKPGNDSALGAEVSSSFGAIVGSIVACIVLMAVIVFCFVWKRRKVTSRESSSGTTKGSPDSTDNPVYGKNQGEVIALPRRQGKDGLGAVGVEEYVYAAVHGDGSKDHSVQSKPIYQSLIKDNVQDSVYTSLNKKTPLPEYSYNHLQHPTYNPPHSKDVPSKLLYNKLQKPNDDDYLEPGLTINGNENGTSEEPVYNVLEDPNANPDLQDSEPVYNVLEDPNSNLVPSQEPLYNVLEDPDDNYDNAPVDEQNHAASGQDNIAYTSNIDLVIPLSPTSPDYDVLEGPEGTLSDPTYQPLSIRTQDDVYQPLDRASQPVYQTLDPSESTV